MANFPAIKDMTNDYWLGKYPYPKTCQEVKNQIPLIQSDIAFLDILIKQRAATKIPGFKDWQGNPQYLSPIPQYTESFAYLSQALKSRQSLITLLKCDSPQEQSKPVDTFFQTEPVSVNKPSNQTMSVNNTQSASSIVSGIKSDLKDSFESNKNIYAIGGAAIIISIGAYLMFKK